MIEPEIYGIFPTPVYLSYVDKKISKEENNFINNKKIETIKNAGNITTKNNYILEQRIFKKLKKELELKVIDYFNKIICSSNDIKPYITQSWLNYTKKNEYHHEHEHPNSIISGVFYINADKNHDKIIFYNKTYRQIHLHTENFNAYNSSRWWFPVETGQVVLFPSYLTHCVENKESDNTRISLAFNVFIKGEIGNNYLLTQLKL